MSIPRDGERRHSQPHEWNDEHRDEQKEVTADENVRQNQGQDAIDGKDADIPHDRRENELP